MTSILHISLGNLFSDADIQKRYLVSSMRSLISQQERANASPSLLSGHIRLLVQFANTHSDDPAKVLGTARKYTIKAPKSAHVWHERLVAERQFGVKSEGRSGVDRAWAEARRVVGGSGEELEKIWTWGLFREDSVENRLTTYEVRRRIYSRRNALTG
jgi:U3 small nucleolar RNA-associated protein 6